MMIGCTAPAGGVAVCGCVFGSVGKAGCRGAIAGCMAAEGGAGGSIGTPDDIGEADIRIRRRSAYLQPRE